MPISYLGFCIFPIIHDLCRMLYLDTRLDDNDLHVIHAVATRSTVVLVYHQRMASGQHITSRSSLFSHRFPTFYACYLLKSIQTPLSKAYDSSLHPHLTSQFRSTYIGSTPNPHRRIRCFTPSVLIPLIVYMNLMTDNTMVKLLKVHRRQSTTDHG